MNDFDREEFDPDVDSADGTAFIARHLMSERHAGIVILTVRAPVAPLETLLESHASDLGIMWSPADAWAYAASGVTHLLPLHGRDRLTQLREALDAPDGFWRTAVIRAVAPNAPRPRLFGGLAFEAGSNDASPWEEFSDGFFVLARWTYSRSRSGGGAYLTLAVDMRHNRAIDAIEVILTEYDAILSALEMSADGVSKMHLLSELMPAVPGQNVAQIDPLQWSTYVDRILEEIRAGRLLKVVAVRGCRVVLPKHTEPAAIFSRLGNEFPMTTRFLVQRARTALVGASPELLFQKTGADLRTEALAGTIKSTGSEFPRRSLRAAHLLNSTKDSGEHELVVHHIVESLRAIADDVTIAASPQPRKVSNIIHLHTPVSARLKSGIAAVDALAVLHPTPAVGGMPRLAALDFIRHHEQLIRGWYTGTVGWIDAEGDATFNVVIRSGLIEGGNVAHVFAGAGIVDDSDAQSEWDETALKQEPMFRALGVAL